MLPLSENRCPSLPCRLAMSRPTEKLLSGKALNRIPVPIPGNILPLSGALMASNTVASPAKPTAPQRLWKFQRYSPCRARRWFPRKAPWVYPRSRSRCSAMVCPWATNSWIPWIQELTSDGPFSRWPQNGRPFCPSASTPSGLLQAHNFSHSPYP